MKCPICKNNNLIDGTTTLTLEQNDAVFVFKKVPARVCDNCYEAFVSEKQSRKAFDIMKSELKKGAQLEVLNYAA